MDTSRLRSLLIVGMGLLAVYLLFGRRSTPPTIVRPPAVVAPAPTERGPEQVQRILGGRIVVDVSNYSAAVRSWRLTHSQFDDACEGLHPRAPESECAHARGISTTSQEAYYPLHSNIVFRREGHDVVGSPFLTWRFEPRTNDRSVELVATPANSNLELRRTITAHTDYSLRVRTRIINHGAPGDLAFSQGVWHYLPKAEEEGRFFAPSWHRSEGLCHFNGRMVRRPNDELLTVDPARDALSPSAQMVGVANQYFLTALVPASGEPAACHLQSEPRGLGPDGSLLHAQLSWRPTHLAQGDEHEYFVLAYLGPKTGPDLTAVSPLLRDAQDLGTFSFIARVLLKFLQLLYGFVGNWGAAIALLTLSVRLLLLPLTTAGLKSMAAMQRLKPQMDDINARFEDDPEKKQLAIMELYRKEGVNPVAGCLPQLAQLPVWWALYATLQNSPDLYSAPFAFYWTDLSAPDRFFILPLVLGAVMFLQQKLMPPVGSDPVQQKMLTYGMPIFLTVISLFLPSGLALYMLVNSILAMIQQRIIKSRMDAMAAQAQAATIGVRLATEDEDPTPEKSKNKSKGGRRGGR